MSIHFSQQVSAFHGRSTPESGFLTGYALLIAVIEKGGTNIPLPDRLAITTEKHQRYNTDQWQVFTIRYKPNNDLISHLVFALKYEGIDLYILKKLFHYTGHEPVLHMIRKEPTSQYSRTPRWIYWSNYSTRIMVGYPRIKESKKLTI